MKKIMIAGGLLLTVLGVGLATRGDLFASAEKCRVQGVWRLERATRNGQAVPTNGQQWKIMTKDRFMWVEAESRRDTLPLRTYRDTVRAMSTIGGYGTYRVDGSTVTEHIVLFPDPKWTGRDFKAQCRIEKDQWLHTWYSDFYNDSTGRSRRDTTTEYYRRDE